MNSRVPKILALLGAVTLIAGVAVANGAQVKQQGNLIVAVGGKIVPKKLPRNRLAPIAVSVAGNIKTADGELPPQLRFLRIELNRHGRMEIAGLPVCRARQIHPATTEHALKACRSSLVGQGFFKVKVVLAGQEPYPTQGRLLMFNSRIKGRPALLGQIYSDDPFTTSFVIPFKISRAKRGRYGLILSAALPEALGNWGFVTGVDLNLKRLYRFRGKRRSFVRAGCPAPKGFPGALFPMARTTFVFAGRQKLTSTLTEDCKVRGARR